MGVGKRVAGQRCSSSAGEAAGNTSEIFQRNAESKANACNGKGFISATAVSQNLFVQTAMTDFFSEQIKPV